MQPDDRIRLLHMLESAREAHNFAQGRQRNDLDSDRMLLLSLVKCIEIIGEAANHISDDARAAMRHRLIHAYFDMNRDIIWNTVVEELPPLITDLEAILEG
jgi:uncharacterized protein with HEPN domain